MRWGIVERGSKKRQLKLPKQYAMTSETNNQEQRYQSQRSSETEIELLWSRLKQVESKLEAIGVKLEKIEEDKSKALIWGVRTLVGLLGALVLYVYNMVSIGKH